MSDRKSNPLVKLQRLLNYLDGQLVDTFYSKTRVTLTYTFQTFRVSLVIVSGRHANSSKIYRRYYTNLMYVMSQLM